MKLPQTPGIYAIVNRVTGRIYIGQTYRFYDRWRIHQAELRRGVHCNPALQADWLLYTSEAFEFRILEEMTQYDFMRNSNKREYFYIASNLGNLYNIRTPDDILEYVPDNA